MSNTSGYKAMLGLRLKDTYEELINYLLTDQEVIRYPDRYAKQLRESPYLTQLDGEGLGLMQDQQEKQFKEEQKENVIRQVAGTSTKSVSHLKAEAAHQESFSQTDAVDPGDVKMGATAQTQTDDPVMVSSGTGTDYDPPPPPSRANPIKTSRTTSTEPIPYPQPSPLPPQHHYVHLVQNHHPPPPPPEAPRISKSTSDMSTQFEDIPENKTVPVYRKPKGDIPVPSDGGEPPGPPQPPSLYTKAKTKTRQTPYDTAVPPVKHFYMGDTPPIAGHEDRALSVEMRKADEERKLWENNQEKRAKNATVARQSLMDLDKAPHPMKRAADEASNSVAQQALELAQASAKARRARDMQAKQEQIAMHEQLTRQTQMQKAELEAAKQQLDNHHKDRAASHQKRVAAEKADLEAQRQQIDAQRKSLERKKAPRSRSKDKSTMHETKTTRGNDGADYVVPVRQASVETVNHTSRSRSKAPILPTKTQTTQPVAKPDVKPTARSRSRAKSEAPPKFVVVVDEKKPRGRPRTKAPVVQEEKKPRGRPKSIMPKLISSN